MEKNVESINKIIGALSYNDFQVAHKKFWKNRKSFDKKGNPIRFPGYSLRAETMEAIQIKRDYLDGKISESEYKSFCLNYHLRTVNEN